MNGKGWRLEDGPNEKTLDPTPRPGHELSHAMGLDHGAAASAIRGTRRAGLSRVIITIPLAQTERVRHPPSERRPSPPNRR